MLGNARDTRPTVEQQCFLCVLAGCACVKDCEVMAVKVHDVFSIGPASAPMDGLGNNYVTCVFCVACPCSAYISEQNSEAVGVSSNRDFS
jgi:hypothetical protein